MNGKQTSLQAGGRVGFSVPGMAFEDVVKRLGGSVDPLVQNVVV